MSLEIALKKIAEAKKQNAPDLDLSKLKLTEIPVELSQLTKVTMLNLNGNQLTEIKNLGQLLRLTNLDLNNNNLTAINGLDKNTKLTRLYLRGNEIEEINGLEELVNLSKLYLSGNQIKKIKGLETLSRLTNLSLDNNQLTEIENLENLTLLNVLDLSRNKLTEINNLEKLALVNTLFLNNNQIKEIKGLEKNKWLTALFLSNNLVVEIKNLEQLTQLVTLDLSVNQISEVNGLKTLSKLASLDLSNNYIKELKDSENFNTLNQLEELNLKGNQITEIPEYLATLGLPIYIEDKFVKKGIFVEKNPFTNPPPEIIRQGNEAILEYFKQRKKAGEELFNEAKLILLGDGRSGKTSLANRLLGKELPKENDRTQGVEINIGEYSFQLSNGKGFKINIWDFAGQDKYKTLHQLFYTDSSLYVMVAESGNSTIDFDDWFQTAELFGEGSPLLLVLNDFKDGIGTGSFDTNYWKRQFPDLLKEVFTANLKTRQNFPAVEEYIRLLAQTLTHTKYALPSNWTAIRRILNERRNEQYISLREYLRICNDNNLPERDSAFVLSSVLHKIGDCLHYQKNDVLRQYIILKNEWATDAVYKILDDKIVTEQKCGFFDSQDINRIWNNDEYVDMRPQLLELMKQFRLAYQLPNKNEYVTPPLLQPASPEGYEWPNVNSLELYIDYDFLPRALITQFIVTRHSDIAKSRTLVWRHGVVLEWGNEALAEVVKTKSQGRDAFHIRTQGRNRKEMMTLILKTFRELHVEYKGIKYKEKVPCTCEGCKDKKNEQHYFTLANLNFRLENKEYEVQCDNSLKKLNVLDLLENSFVFEQFEEGRGIRLGEGIKSPTYKPKTLKAFISYSKFDGESNREGINYLEEFKETLSPLTTHNNLIETWDDTNLFPGENWDNRIKECLETSDIIFLLVSNSFLNTNYIIKNELKIAFEREKKGSCIVIPIIIRDCAYTDIAWFSNLNAIPRKGKTIISWENKWNSKDQAWKHVYDEVKKVIENFRKE